VSDYQWPLGSAPSSAKGVNPQLPFCHPAPAHRDKKEHTSGTGLATSAEAALVVTDLLAAMLGEAKARMGAALVKRAARENMVVVVVLALLPYRHSKNKNVSRLRKSVMAQDEDEDEGWRGRSGDAVVGVVGTRVCSVGRQQSMGFGTTRSGLWIETRTSDFFLAGRERAKNGGPSFSVGA